VVRLIRDCFPRVRQVTTYARSSTIAKMSAKDLAMLKDAGLTRVHVGLESGSMPVLRLVKKGASPRIHVEAGKKVKQAGLFLSEYVMPGLGGRELSEEHAVMTAGVLNEIDPDYIRLRTLFAAEGTPLGKLAREGKFVALTDDETVSEIRLFLKSLNGISSRVASDHALNLLMELEGKLPEEKQALLTIIDRYLELPKEERLLFRLGRRIGLLQRLDHLKVPPFRRQVEELLEELKRSSTESVENVIYQLMGRYI
jgi:radical SAM superfamily enzyme